MKLGITGRLTGRGWPSPAAEPASGAADLLELKPPKRARVHLGCGDVYRRGYLNVDLPPSEGVAGGSSRPDLQSDVTKVHCPAGTLEEVRLHHLFEHFERAEALALLLRWYGWLRPSGRLVIETPDFDGCVAGFDVRSPAQRSLILRHIFGSQEAPWAQHRDGWSDSRFRHVLGELGFAQITTSQTFSDPGRLLPNVIVTAQRPENGLSPAAQRDAALSLLRQSMNGENATEQVLFERWREQFESTCAASPS
jgi:hypothetical protein